jgi:hypothetical protein
MNNKLLLKQILCYKMFRRLNEIAAKYTTYEHNNCGFQGNVNSDISLLFCSELLFIGLVLCCVPTFCNNMLPSSLAQNLLLQIFMNIVC